jgi:hypothetical protein
MTINELTDLLCDIEDYLDNYIDVNDGPEGMPVANKAMSLQQACTQARLRLERGGIKSPLRD